MPNFDIQYNRVGPSGEANVAPITADVAAPWRAVAQVGGAMSNTGQGMTELAMKIQHAENEMEISTLERKKNDIWTAAWNTIQQTPDPDQRQQVFDKATADMQALSSKRKPVSEAYQRSLNNDLPQYQFHFNSLNNEMRIKSAKATLESNYQDALENGNAPLAHSLLDAGVSGMLITPGDAEVSRKKMAGDMTLAQAERMLLRDDPTGAITKLADPAAMNNDQLEKRAKLLNLAQRTQADNSDAFQKDILNSALQADGQNLSVIQRNQLATQLRQKIVTNQGLSGSDARVMVNWLDSWEKGVTKPADPLVVANLNDEIDKIPLGQANTKEVLAKIDKATRSGELGYGEEANKLIVKLRGDVSGKLRSAQPRWMTDEISDARRQIITNESDLNLAEIRQDPQSVINNLKNIVSLQAEAFNMYRQDMEKYLQSHPDATQPDIYAQSKSLLTIYRNISGKKVEELRVKRDKEITMPNWYQKMNSADKLAVDKRIQMGYSVDDIGKVLFKEGIISE